MSNNIYDILKKMQNLEAPKQSLTESKKAKPDYIDIDKDGDKTEPMKKAAQEKSKGAVAEAVATVERQLAEKYQGFKKSVAEGVKLKGTIKSTDSGEEYRAEPGHRVKAEFEPGSTGKPKIDFVKDKSSDSEQTGQAAKPADQNKSDQPKVDEDALDFLRDPEGIAKNRAAKVASDQRFADRSAKRFAGQVGDQYHDQLMKTMPSYRDEYMSQAKNTRYDKLDKLAQTLQAKHDPMGGPTNIDYEKIKKDPMPTTSGDRGTDWRPWGPGPKEYYDSDEFGRPVREEEIDEAEVEEGNKFSGNLMKARAKGLKRADLDGDGDMEPVREGWFDDAADRAIANVNAQTAKDLSDERRRTIMDPTYGTPNTEKFEKDLAASRARGSKFYDTPEKQGPFKGRYPSDILRKDAEERDIEGQNKYRDRTSPGIINKAKDFIGYDKPDSAYAPKTMREGWEEMQKYLEKKRGPESKGGSGKKAGTRYGGSAQRDDDEETDGEGQAVVKKKGRPKGTGGGAKFNFKKPKD